MSSCSSDATQMRCFHMCRRTGQLGDPRLSVYLSFLLCSLWVVKVCVVSLAVLGSTHFYIWFVWVQLCSTTLPCGCVHFFLNIKWSLSLLYFRSVPVTSNWSFSAVYQKCLYREVYVHFTPFLVLNVFCVCGCCTRWAWLGSSCWAYVSNWFLFCSFIVKCQCKYSFISCA